MAIQPRPARVLMVLGHALAVACVLLPRAAAAQGLTGALIGTVKDAQGGVISGAVVRISSPALIGGPQTITTDKGELRFPALPPGLYALDIEFPGFRPYHEDGISIGAGATIERPVELQLGGVENSVVVDGSGPRLDARNPGFGTRFGAEDLDAIPMRRFSPYRVGQDGARDLADISGGPQHAGVGLRFWRRPKPVPDGRHEHHRDRQRRRACRSGRRLHPGTADPIGGRVGRVRQRPGRRRERDHQVRQ